MKKKKEEQQELTEEQKEKERASNYRFFAWLLMICLSIIGLRVYWNKTFAGVVVDGTSMNQTLQNKEKLLMRYTSPLTDLKHGDVIVVDVSDYEECGDVEYLIKRLIAMEGDKVKCEDGQVYICKNWENNAEGYVAMNEPYAHYTSAADYDFKEYEVKQGEIFFLGDNRSYSIDSRYNEFNGSHLKTLYKAKDIYGIVPDWAITNREFIKKIFFS